MRAKSKPRPVNNDPGVSKSSFSCEVSENLKYGPGFMMKIASKWVDAETKDAESDDKTEENIKSATSRKLTGELNI